MRIEEVEWLAEVCAQARWTWNWSPHSDLRHWDTIWQQDIWYLDTGTQPGGCLGPAHFHLSADGLGTFFVSRSLPLHVLNSTHTIDTRFKLHLSEILFSWIVKSYSQGGKYEELFLQTHRENKNLMKLGLSLRLFKHDKDHTGNLTHFPPKIPLSSRV